MEQTPQDLRIAIVTAELPKLPAEIQRLMDPATPLPADCRFFEERQTISRAVQTGALGVAMAAIGIALVFPGVLLSLYVAIVGLVLILGGLLMVGAAYSRISSMQQQASGKQTRYGVFITPAAVVVRTQLDYTLVPHAAYHDLQGSNLYFRTGDATRSLTFPSTLVGTSQASLQAAVRDWAKGT